MKRVIFVAIIMMIIDAIVSDVFNIEHMKYSEILIIAFGVVILSKLDKLNER